MTIFSALTYGATRGYYRGNVMGIIPRMESGWFDSPRTGIAP